MTTQTNPAPVVGNVTTLGYLACLLCSQRYAKVKGTLTPVYAGATHADEPCDFCKGKLESLALIRGDFARYTGEVQQIAGGTFYEVVLLEGHRKGATALTQRAPGVAFLKQ